MIELRMFWFYLVVVAGICLCVAGVGGYKIGYSVAPEVRTETITNCFSSNVEIKGFGPMTDQDRAIVEQCGYDNRLTTPTQ